LIAVDDAVHSAVGEAGQKCGYEAPSSTAAMQPWSSYRAVCDAIDAVVLDLVSPASTVSSCFQKC